MAARQKRREVNVARLEDLQKGAQIVGIAANGPVTIVDLNWHGSSMVEVVYTDADGNVDRELLDREYEPRLRVIEQGRAFAFDSDGNEFKLAAEAHRIRLAYLFDPLLAIHTSLVDPLPHQITAVYDEMLRRQPLRFLLADDPGAGKTIMTGLYIKELIARGDVKRCFICCPGSLATQWQDEMWDRFQLNFDIITRERFESARSGNPFAEIDFVIARLDQLSRSEEIQDKLRMSDWDLVVVDEAHKMSATYFGNEAKYTKRFRLGQLLSSLTRHFLLLTATPHNGKEEDFQLFMSLIDGDRFEGRYREGIHTADVSDLMRRVTKEELLKFDCTPLFPERFAYSVKYKLSEGEARLYHAVTDYVREEFNRADALEDDGRKGTVGFALMILQRRLASSPEAIYRSLERRRKRLESRVREEKLLQRGADARISLDTDLPEFDEAAWDDLDDAPDDEVEKTEETVVDRATAAQTIAELELEIETLKGLEILAAKVLRSEVDTKWLELSKLLQDQPEMKDAHGERRKVVIFTEHRDTLNYLVAKISTMLGRPEAVVTIHGSLAREHRRTIEHSFKQDPQVHVLVATDAAGEGINLQRAHLIVNLTCLGIPTASNSDSAAFIESVRPKCVIFGTSSPTKRARAMSTTVSWRNCRSNARHSAAASSMCSAERSKAAICADC